MNIGVIMLAHEYRSLLRVHHIFLYFIRLILCQPGFWYIYEPPGPAD